MNTIYEFWLKIFYTFSLSPHFLRRFFLLLFHLHNTQHDIIKYQAWIWYIKNIPHLCSSSSFPSAVTLIPPRFSAFFLVQYPSFFQRNFTSGPLSPSVPAFVQFCCNDRAPSAGTHAIEHREQILGTRGISRNTGEKKGVKGPLQQDCCNFGI